MQACSHYDAIAFKCELVHIDVMNPSEELRALLRRTMENRNLTVTGWARLAKLPESTVRNFLAGRSETLTYSTLSNLAKSLGIPLYNLIKFEHGPQTTVLVQSEISADRWQADNVDVNETWFELSLPPDPRYAPMVRHGAILQDDSFNMVFREGSIVLFSDYFMVGRRLMPNDIVICAETRESGKGDGLEFRRSIRRVIDDGERKWLAFQSTSPRWQSPIPLIGWQDPADDILQNPSVETDSPYLTTIEGVVIGSYRLE